MHSVLGKGHLPGSERRGQKRNGGKMVQEQEPASFRESKRSWACRPWWWVAAVPDLDGCIALFLWSHGVANHLAGQPVLHCLHHLFLC